MPDGKAVLLMDKDYQERLIDYRTTMALAESMLHEGIITAKDYGKIDRIIANRKGLSLSSICCRNPLITSRNRGNIRQTAGGETNGTDD